MLTIRPAQIELLANLSEERFEQKLVAHVKKCWLAEAKKSGEAAIRRSIRQAMERVERIHQGVLDYQENVYGPEVANVGKAPEALAVLAQKPVTLSADNFDSAMREEMTRAFPQEAAYIGDEKIIDPAARAERLEKKAVTWVEHVLARPRDEVRT